MRWVSLHAGLRDLNIVLYDTLVSSYGVPACPSLRRESCPLPMSFICWLEQHVCQDDCGAADRLLLFASQTCNDAQSVTSSAFTTVFGQFVRKQRPHRLQCVPLGSLVKPRVCTGVNCGFRQSKRLRQPLVKPTSLFCRTSCFQPAQYAILDVIASLCLTDGNVSALAISSSAAFCRSAGANVGIPTTHAPAGHPQHEIYATFRQTSAPESWRQQQGHHRRATSGTSVSLNSRDDTHDSLKLQALLIARKGSATTAWSSGPNCRSHICFACVDKRGLQLASAFGPPGLLGPAGVPGGSCPDVMRSSSKSASSSESESDSDCDCSSDEEESA